VAILGADILGHALPDLQRHRKTKTPGVCPACEETARIEREFLGFIAEQEEREFIDFFTASEGLCVPHYRQLVAQIRRVPSWLEDFQQRKFESLLERTKTFIEYSAWGRQADFATLSDRDKVVWKEIALALRGNRD